MKNALLYLSLLLASGTFAGSWQYVPEPAAPDLNSIVQNDSVAQDSAALDDLDHAALPDIAGLPQTTATRQIYFQTASQPLHIVRGSHPIRAPPVSHA